MTTRLPTDHLYAICRQPPARSPRNAFLFFLSSTLGKHLFVSTKHTHKHMHARKQAHTHTHTYTLWCVRCSKAAALFMLPTAVTTFWTKNETPSPVAWAGLSRCVHLSLTLLLWACVRVCVCVLVTC